MSHLLVYFDAEDAYDVVERAQVKTGMRHSEVAKGDRVIVRWHGVRFFPATVVSTSDSERELLDEMAVTEKSDNSPLKLALQAPDLVQEALARDTLKNLERENASLKRKIEELELKLQKSQDADACLEKARKLLKTVEELPYLSSIDSEVLSIEPVTSPGEGAVAVDAASTDGESFDLSYHMKIEEGIRPEGQLRHKKAINTVELMPGSSTYVPQDALIGIMKNKSPTSLARCLLGMVFTDEALLTCSVRGNRCKTTGKSDAGRPGLDQKAVNAIIAFTQMQAIGAESSTASLVKAIGTRLSELRSIQSRDSTQSVKTGN
ncbi:unnamed protein product, partial [Ixodes hexagonus]